MIPNQTMIHDQIMIPLFYPYIPKEKILKELSDTLNGRWIGQGPKVDLFEKRFGKKMGYKYPMMVNSGTSALELAYHLLDLKKDDVVVVPILDAVSGQVGLLRRGCKIIFCDIERDSLTIDPNSLVKILKSNKVKAVIGVHLGGIHFSKKVYSICERHHVPLIVDAAQYTAPTKGDYICHSFQAIKHITTGDGGMLIVNSKEEYERAKKLRWFGLSKDLKKHNPKIWKQRAMTSQLEEAGYKFQPTDIDACFALASLPDLDKVIKHRKQLFKEYQNNLKDIKEVQTVAGDTYWLLTIIAEKRDQLANYLAQNEVETNLVHVRNDQYKIFGGKRLNLPNMDWVEKRYLCLPLNPMVKTSDVRYICRSIRSFYDK